MAVYSGERNPDTLEFETKLREGLRDALGKPPDIRDADLLVEVKRLKKLDVKK